MHTWGFHAHKIINKTAIYTLPEELMAFYKPFDTEIEALAIAADKRRYIDPHEAPRHYLDFDHYKKSENNFPKDWDSAVKMYSKDTLFTYGILPWHCFDVYKKLEQAFKVHDTPKIIQLSADLGHYISDGCVPLHCTENYNGQLSDQHGIHSLWESRIPELFSVNYQLFTDEVKHINHPQTYIWEQFFISFTQKDSVLFIEKELSLSFQADRKYRFEDRNNQHNKVYTAEYCKEYQKRLNGMVEKNMKRAIIATASLWYTAWKNAGSPNLQSVPFPANLLSPPKNGKIIPKRVHE